MTGTSRWRRTAAAGACTALLATGALAVQTSTAPPAQAATESVTITPDPWYASDPFEGWGTSLVWMANATGGYPDELREPLYQAIFGEDGLNLNLARYNAGGGHASDVTDYLRPGGAVEGYWAEDATGDLYGAPTTVDNRDQVLTAWDPDDQDHYDFTADATQRWWVERLVADEQITHWELFANSAPYFMTENGYVSGGFDGDDEQLRVDAMDSFAGYLTEVADFLEREHGLQIDTIDPFNEPNTNYWSTQLEDGVPVGGRQEGMHVGPERQVQMIAALAERLQAGTTATEATISAMDETNPGTFARNWAAYPDQARSAVEQMNVHTYGTGDRRVVRDLAKSADTPLWMSEVGGSWHTGFDPVTMDNALGMAERIQSDLRELEPTAWVLWQPVEDLYNMQATGEDLNWGSVFVDFDCVEVEPGVWKSERRIDDAGGDASAVEECEIVHNAKFGAIQNFTQFIRPGDSLIATDSADATAAVDSDGLTLVYRNDSDQPREVSVDLSRFGQIAAQASVQTFTTTEGTEQDPTANAIVPGEPAAVDGTSATVEAPARSITTVVIDGVTGVAEDAAPVVDGGSYQLLGVQSAKALTAGTEDATVIRSPGTTPAEAADQVWTVHEAPGGERGDLRPYVLTSSDGRVLGATDDGTDLRDIPVSEAATTSETRWLLTTEDTTSWSWVNEALSQALEVSGQSTEEGARVALWSSSGGTHQAWQIRDLHATGAHDVQVSTLAGVPPAMPATVLPTYAWGDGVPASVEWDLPGEDTWQQTGEVTVEGVATDVYGNEVPVQATVVVGGFTVTDPVSLTVRQGVGPETVAAAAPATVPARTGASELTFDTEVTWDFSVLTAEDLAAPGVLTVPGTALSNEPGEELDATLSVIVTEPVPVNVAPLESTTVSATFVEPGYTAEDTRNEVLDDKAWSNWKSGEKNASDTLTYELGETEVLDSATVYFYRDGSHTSWAEAIAFEYRDTDGQWLPVPGYDEPQPVTAPEDGSAPVVTADLSEVEESTGLRVVMDAMEDTHMIVSEVEIMALGPGMGSVADLAALRLDGQSVDGFAPEDLEYQAQVQGSRFPLVSAVPVDQAASVDVQQPTEQDPRAEVTVTSADGQVSQTYTVDVERQISLTDVQIFGDVSEGGTVRALVDVDPADAAVEYQWLIDGEEPAGPAAQGPALAQATLASPAVVLPEGSAGAAVQVRVAAEADGFLPAEVMSEPVEIAAAEVDDPDDGSGGPDDGSGGPDDGSGGPDDPGSGSGEPDAAGGPDAGEDTPGGSAADDSVASGTATDPDGLPVTGAPGVGIWALVALAAVAVGAGLVALRRHSRA
ncbi:MAG TPA: glycoside hydrolase [Ruania sp.]|nr:glycoside hydrolase [Ruania sp.]